MKHTDTKKLTILAMLCALAYVAVSLIRIPAVEFLKYEPKDVIITFGGFLYGPSAALAVSVIVSFLEMVTISDTSWIGLLMNILSTAAFACTASLLYKKKHTLSGAVVGLCIGTVLMTAAMLLWNYLLTPLYMKTPRADVAAMLVPIFLPFNLIKGSLNSALTALLYRPLVQSLRRAKLFPRTQSTAQPEKQSKLVFYLASLACLLFAVVMFLIFLAPNAWRSVKDCILGLLGRG